MFFFLASYFETVHFSAILRMSRKAQSSSNIATIIFHPKRLCALFRVLATLTHTPNTSLRKFYSNYHFESISYTIEYEPMEGTNSPPPRQGNSVNTENNFLHRHNFKMQTLQ